MAQNIIRQLFFTFLNVLYFSMLTTYLEEDFAMYFTISQIVLVSTYLSYSFQPIQINLLQKYTQKEIVSFFQRSLSISAIISLISACVVFALLDITSEAFLLGIIPTSTYIFSNKNFVNFHKKDIINIAKVNVSESWYKFVIILLIYFSSLKLIYLISLFLGYTFYAIISFSYDNKASVIRDISLKYILSQFGGVIVHLLAINLINIYTLKTSSLKLSAQRGIFLQAGMVLRTAITGVYQLKIVKLMKLRNKKIIAIFVGLSITSSLGMLVLWICSSVYLEVISSVSAIILTVLILTVSLDIGVVPIQIAQSNKRVLIRQNTAVQLYYALIIAIVLLSLFWRELISGIYVHFILVIGAALIRVIFVKQKNWNEEIDRS